MSEATVRPVTMWAITNRGGYIIRVAHQKGGVVEAEMKQWPDDWSWRRARERYGLRVQKVVVTAAHPQRREETP
jgi:hypothetical protein